MSILMNSLLLLFVLLITSIIVQSFFASYLFRFLFLLTKSQALSTNLYAIILLPGTILHELSHWLVAEILQVPTGKFDYMPKWEQQYLKMGSLQIAKTDPFRRTIIGIAPLCVGIFLLFLIIYFAPLTLTLNLVNLIRIWLAFVIMNTMFPSAKDLEQVLVPIIIFIFFFFFWWRMGFVGSSRLLNLLNPFIIKFNYVFTIVITIDLLVVISVKLLTFISGKILHRRFVEK